MNYYLFPQGTALLVAGKDTPRYLNARLTNDAKALPLGSGCLAAALSPQGRTEGFFSVLRLEEHKFVLISDRGETAQLQKNLMRFAVADRVTTSPLFEGVKLFHVFDVSPELTSTLQQGIGAMPTSTLEFASALGPDACISVRKRGPTIGLDCAVSPQGEKNLLQILSTIGARQISDSEYELTRIKFGLPSFPNELGEGTLFAEAGISNAVSFKKGCYVGQEVIEKVDALGKLPRQLTRLRFPGQVSLTPEAPIQAEDGSSAGEITSFAFDPEENVTYCFASVKSSSLGSSRTFRVNNVTGVPC